MREALKRLEKIHLYLPNSTKIEQAFCRHATNLMSSRLKETPGSINHSNFGFTLIGILFDLKMGLFHEKDEIPPELRNFSEEEFVSTTMNLIKIIEAIFPDRKLRFAVLRQCDTEPSGC
jgi:hypothetical protein